MEAAIIRTLLDASAVAEFVDDRVTPVVLDQNGGFPAVVVCRISGGDDMHMQGPSGLREGRIQVDVYGRQAEGYAAIKAAAGAVRGVLNGLRATVDNTTIQAAFCDSERDSIEDTGADRLLRVSMDFTVWAGSAS